MPVLSDSRHEQFAQYVASGLPASQAYVKAGYSENGARQSASRLLQNAAVQARVTEILQEISSRLEQSSIRDLESRLKAYQDRWMRMQLLMAARAAGGLNLPGAETGLLDSAGEFDGKLMRELRQLELQVAKEMGQYAERVEHSGSVGLIERLNAGRKRLQESKDAE